MSPPVKTTLTWHESRVSVQSSPITKAAPQDIINDVIQCLPQTRHSTEMVCSSLSPENGQFICRSLDEDPEVESRCIRMNYNSYTGILRVKMNHIPLLDVHQWWINFSITEWAFNRMINEADVDRLWSGVGTTFENFSGIYQGSVKQPDQFLRVNTDLHPRIVVEAGWSESVPRLRSDKDLWLDGTTSVVLVILLEWSVLSNNRIKGTVETWRRDATGSLVSTTIAIFPASAPLPQNELIQFTKGELFGPTLVPGQASGAVLDLDIAELREYAADVIENMGMQPA